jgi:integrase
LQTLDSYERRLKLRRPATRRNYEYGLNMFKASSGLDKIQLLKLAQRNISDVKLLVGEAMAAAIKAGKKRSTADIIAKSVAFYLRAFNVPFDMSEEYRPRVITHGSKAMKKEHLREIWDSFTPDFQKRNRAILMLMKDSGLRVSDVANLTAEQYWEAEEVKNGASERFRIFEVSDTQKTGDLAHIHIGPEAVVAIENYLEGRRNGPIFLRMVGGRSQGKKIEPRTDGGMDPKAITEIYINLKNRRDLKQSYKKISAHSTRKYHFSALQHLGENAVRWLQGKSTSEYWDETPPNFPQAYIDSYESLRVFGSEVVKDMERDKAQEKAQNEIERLKLQLRKEGEKIGEAKERSNLFEELHRAQEKETAKLREELDALRKEYREKDEAVSELEREFDAKIEEIRREMKNMKRS